MAYLEEIRAVEAFEALPRAQRNLVFYSEGPAYWPHFRPIIEQLTSALKYPLVYLSSSKEDPGLAHQSPLVKPFYIGAGGPRKMLFSNLEADVMVMTMPDLDNLSIEKSKKCKCYAYVFHSPVSTHMVYLDGAFDHYDAIFCVGPHHEQEIRKREALLGLNKKELIAHGYGRLDDIIASAPAQSSKSRAEKTKVLVAPSWGPDGVFETIGEDLIRILLDTGFDVVARPHPQTMRLSGKAVKKWATAFSGNENFTLETDMSAKQSFYEADVMISDWSGAALDFAFGLLKPVIFIDTPRKVRNAGYGDLGVEPLEVSIRSRISEIIAPENLNKLPTVIEKLAGAETDNVAIINSERDQWIYNPGNSGKIGAAKLMEIAQSFAAPETADLKDAKKLMMRDLEVLLENGVGEKAEAGNLAYFLKTLLQPQATVFSEDDILKLESLCRAVDVLKRVRQSYDLSFRKSASREPLAVQAYPALVYAYVLAADQLADHDRGHALKFLNTAGKALGMYASRGGVSFAPMLESMIHQRLDALGLMAA